LDRLVAITGANGFIGQALVNHLVAEGFSVRALQRQEDPLQLPGAEHCCIGDMTSEKDYTRALAGVSVVVHLAARVHREDAYDENAHSLYERTNTITTINLARAAAESLARRFILLSTVAVNGQATTDTPLVESDEPNPRGPYAVSKWKAEQGLRHISQQRGLEFVILRSPIVYGPGVRGNFLRLLNLISKVRFLPFGDLDNRRSMVGLGNLCDFVARCIRHEKASGQTFFVSDGQDLSVKQLVRLLSSVLNRRSVLVPIPKPVLQVLATLAGKRDAINKLVEPFRVDIRKAREIIDWMPPNSVEAEIARTASWYRQEMEQKRD
jgi:nucleoside-diphosphate-sugar epimerase